jgi:hypothetical protein
MSSKSAFGATTALALLMLTNIGSAEDAPLLRKGSWPIRNGHNYQPTQRELRDLHREDVTSKEAREIDRLYDELMTDGEKSRKQHPSPKP